MDNNIIVSKENLTLLKVLYKNAINNGDGTLMFQGECLLVSYTKYLIEYIEDKLNAK